jgi:thiol-disulfide isomerase/thioredoxin
MITRKQLIGAGALLVIIVLCAATAVWWYTEERAQERDVVADLLTGEAAVASYRNLEGGEVNLAPEADQAVVITSWASWCPQCADDLVLLNRLGEQYPPTALRIVAVNRSEPRAQAQRFMTTLPPLPRIEFILDQNDYFFHAVSGYAMPETLFYSTAGELVFHKRGNLTQEELETQLRSIVPEGQ